MISFRTRLAVGMSSICLVTSAAIGLLAYQESRIRLEAALDDGLINLARTEIASQVGSGTIQVHEPKKSQFTVRGEEGYEKYAWIEDKSDNILARTSNVNPRATIVRFAPAEDRAWAGMTTVGNVTINGMSLRAVYYPLKDPVTQVPLMGIVAIPVQTTLAAEAATGRTILGAAGAAGLLGIIVGLIYAIRVVGPLHELTFEAREIASNNDRRRIAENIGDTEIRELGSAVNRVLSNMEDALAERDAMIEKQRVFLSDASHELRTPIANIRGIAEIALRRPRSPEVYAQDLATILGESERMAFLINDLLLLARNDVNQVGLDVAPIDLRSIAQASLEATSGRAQARDISLTISGESVLIAADQEKIRRAIDNLLDNALRYARSAVKLHVSDGVIEVWNDGPQIADEALQTVFDRFFRTEAARSRADGGFGLGLSIVKAIAEAHGGTASVANNDGVTFRIALPVGEVDQPIPAAGVDRLG